jgi:hypothetical protein
MMRFLGIVVGVAALGAGLAGAQDKKDDKSSTGPFQLPTLAAVKDKCKTTEDENSKLEAIYKDAATREDETKKRAKDNGQDKKDLDKFLGLGKVDTINKIKDALDKDQQKSFDELLAASNGDKKKKKNNN